MKVRVPLLERLRCLGSLSNDNELLLFGGSEYTFVCCVYSEDRLSELTQSPRAHAGRRLGCICPEHQPVYAVRGVPRRGYLVLREDDTLLLYQKITEKYHENSCQKHHKEL